MRLEKPSASEATVVHEVQVLSVVQQQKMESTLHGIEPEYVVSYRSDDREQNGTLCAVLDLAVIITQPHRKGAKRYAREIVRRLHCAILDIN